jgi:hypothetical protein
MIARSALPSSLLLFLFCGLLHVPSVAGATDYTLASFDTTQVTGLTPACNTVYTSTIPGCQPSDFSAINPCSAGCIQSLQSLQTEAQAACNGQSIPAQSMLSYFDNGQGVNELCTNLKQVATTLLTATSTSTSTATALSSQAASTSTTSSLPSSSSTAQPQTTGMLALSKPALLAIIISIVIALAIFFLIAVLTYRKHYRK